MASSLAMGGSSSTAGVVWLAMRGTSLVEGVRSLPVTCLFAVEGESLTGGEATFGCFAGHLMRRDETQSSSLSLIRSTKALFLLSAVAAAVVSMVDMVARDFGGVWHGISHILFVCA